MITQRRLQHLLVLVEHAHFGNAAKALHISQPALTKSIQALEAELGVTLIDRQHGAIGPTAFGDLVIQRSRRMLTEEDELRREIALLAGLETGSLKIALGPYPSVTSGYAAVARLLARHPKVSVTVRVAGWRAVASQVLARTVDLGIAELSGVDIDAQFAAERLPPYNGHFFCRPGHPLLDGKPVTPQRLLAYPWIATRLPPRVAGGLPSPLGAAGTIDPSNGDFVPAVEIDVPMQLGALLAGGDALTIASLVIMERELRSGEVAVVPMTGPSIQAGYGFIYLKDRSLAPAALAYMAEVRAMEAEFVEREAALAAEFGLQ